MRILWRALPGMALAGAVGLGLAYVASGFLPRPQPSLRPPEELRARGLGYGEESPARAIFERNVLHLEQPPFTLPGSPLLPPTEPVPDRAALSRPALPEDFARGLGPAPQAGREAGGGPAPALGPALHGGSSVLGRVARPETMAGQQASSQPPATSTDKPSGKPAGKSSDKPSGAPADPAAK